MKGQRVFQGLTLDHVGLCVGDLDSGLAELVDGYGLEVYGAADGQSVAVGRGGIRMVLTEPRQATDQGAGYLERHGDGVADIAFGVRDAAAAYLLAVRRGARPVREPLRRNGFVTASIMGFGDVVHTFVQRPAGSDARELPWLAPKRDGARGQDAGLYGIDHFAVCLEAGRLGPTVRFYQDVLDFQLIFTERIAVGRQAMNSTVVQSSSGQVTLTLIEPDPSGVPGQIDGFLTAHDGPGVQHIAFACDDIVGSVGAIGRRGVEFLDVPAAYYDLLEQRVALRRHSVTALRSLAILVDEDHDGQLFQIFARSTHRRATLFCEVIERFGARTFGSGNIRALYEAVERERTRTAT